MFYQDYDTIDSSAKETYAAKLTKEISLTIPGLCCNNVKCIGITEVVVDKYLLDGGIGKTMGRHRFVARFIRIKGIIRTV